MPNEFVPVATDEFGEPSRGSMGQLTPTTWSNFLCRSRHPVAAFFHIAFKVRWIF